MPPSQPPTRRRERRSRARLQLRICRTEMKSPRGEGTMFASSTQSGTKLLAGAALVGLFCAALTAPGAAEPSATPPDFSSNQAGWLTVQAILLPGPGGPPPVRNDPAHPRIGNGEAARTGGHLSRR